MQHITRNMAGHYRHAYRPVHAKSHGVLIGKLDVLPTLSEPLAQVVFAVAAFSTIAPIRYGDYVAKIAIVPSSPNLRELTGKHFDAGQGFNPIEESIRDFFRTNTGVWEIQAQLALDDETTPIEDASKQWPEGKSPYQTVATLTVAPQESYSDARQIFVDEQLSFSPWHALTDHRPPGGIMRARQNAYEQAQKFRAQRNLRPHIEPQSIAEVPA